MEAIYFAGGMYGPADNKEFGLVHCTGEARPYLTKNPNGLKLTAQHANLYVLCADGKTAKMVEYRTPLASRVQQVTLTEEQQAAVRTAIDTGYFFS